jgi:hypothetical protein
VNHVSNPINSDPEERWAPVPGWDDRYLVSDAGRVYSKRSMKVLKATTEASGHLRLDLMRDSMRRPARIHVLVLEAFIGPRPEGFEACHNNGNPADNHLANLRWDSKAENTKDRARHGTHQSANKTHCPRGHLLAPPNLDAHTLDHGRRRCRACKMETGAARASGREPDWSKADTRFAELMGGALQLWKRR